MSGHSKWANIKRKKTKEDDKRGKVFARLAKEITVAAREGGGDPEGNPRLKAVIQRAKEANIPNENINRAIQRGIGEQAGTGYEEVVYEGYGPGGVAIMIEALTDNRNRTAGEIRHLFSRNGGSLGEAGCVSWMFAKKGLIVLEKDKTSLDEDELLQMAIEAGALDFKVDDNSIEITTGPADFSVLKEVIIKRAIPIEIAELTMIPQSSLLLEGKEAEQMLRLLDALEEHDDVQEVYTNFELKD